MSRHKALSWLTLILGLAFTLTIMVYYFSGGAFHALDDAYISYKYAANLAEGNGLVFNPGERVWGFTSPLQVLLLALFKSLGFSPPDMSFRLSLIWLSLTAWIMYALVSGLLENAVASFLISLYALTLVNGFDYLGLETNLLIFLQCLFLYCLMKDRPRSAAFLAGLSCLARPDSILLAVPAILLTRGARHLKHLAILLLPGIVWLGFTTVYYHDLLPNTFFSKKGSTTFGFFWRETYAWLSGLPSSPDSLQWLGIHSRTVWKLWQQAHYCLPFLCLAALLNPRVRKNHAAAYTLVFYPWILFLGYSLIGAPTAHTWEYYSGYFFLRLAELVGVCTLVEVVPNRLTRNVTRLKWARLAASGVIVSTLAAAVFLNGFTCFLERDYYRTSTGYGGRYQAYLEVSRWLNANLPAGTTIGLTEVGIIGYLTRMRIIDGYGLINKVAKGETGHQGGNFAFSIYKPRFILSGGFVGYYLTGDGGIYNQIKFFPKTHYLDLSLLKRASD